MKRLLVTGAGGFLGRHVCLAAKSGWKVFGVSHARPVDIEGVDVVHADLMRYDQVKRVFREIEPDAVVHAAAAARPEYCQANPADSFKLNVDVSLNIADLCSEQSIPCVFTSSDLVFDGLNPPYREDDPVSPVSVYGEQKAIAEEGMMRRHAGVVVCRMPLMFGHGSSLSESFVQPMVRAMKEGRELRLFTDEHRTPVSAKDASEGILLVLEKGSGIIHLAGGERISRYDFGLLLAKALGLHGVRLIASRRSDAPGSAPRPPDVSLDNAKALQLGFRPSPLRHELERLFGPDSFAG